MHDSANAKDTFLYCLQAIRCIAQYAFRKLFSALGEPSRILDLQCRDLSNHNLKSKVIAKQFFQHSCVFPTIQLHFSYGLVIRCLLTAERKRYRWLHFFRFAHWNTSNKQANKQTSCKLKRQFVSFRILPADKIESAIRFSSCYELASLWTSIHRLFSYSYEYHITKLWPHI